MKLLRGTIAVGDALEYTVLVGGRVRDDGARVHRASGFVDLGHRVARDDTVVVTLSDDGDPVYLDAEGDMCFGVRLAPAAPTAASGEREAMFEGVGCFRRQRYAVALRWCTDTSLLERLGPVGAPFDAAAKALEAWLAERCRHRMAERSAEERAAFVLKLPWHFRLRCLPLHHVACLWFRAHHHDAGRVALGRLNADALQCVLEFLDGLCFLGFHTRESRDVPAAPLLFVEHTGRFTMGVHVRLLCGGVYVRRPVFFSSGALQWFDADNGDSLRHTKPRNAQLTFTGMHEFTGTVAFPGEGSVRYHSDWPPEVYPGVDIAMIREVSPPIGRRTAVAEGGCCVCA